MRNNHHPARVGKQSGCVGIGSHMRGITVSQLFETVEPPPWHWALKRSITGLQIVLVPLGVVGYARCITFYGRPDTVARQPYPGPWDNRRWRTFPGAI